VFRVIETMVHEPLDHNVSALEYSGGVWRALKRVHYDRHVPDHFFSNYRRPGVPVSESYSHA